MELVQLQINFLLYNFFLKQLLLLKSNKTNWLAGLCKQTNYYNLKLIFGFNFFCIKWSQPASELFETLCLVLFYCKALKPSCSNNVFLYWPWLKWTLTLHTYILAQTCTFWYTKTVCSFDLVCSFLVFFYTLQII